MKTNQPVWKLKAQIGDAQPLKYGGYFIYEDETGVYHPEAEKLVVPDDGREKSTVYRFILEPCTFINGILSDNKFHPEHPVWFADDMSALASFAGQTEEELIAAFTGADLVSKARAWELVGEYFGFDNLDSYPLRLNAEEAAARYAAE